MYVEMILLLSFPPEERHCASSTPIGNLQHRSTRILPSAVPHPHSLVAVRNTLLSIGIRALPACLLSATVGSAASVPVCCDAVLIFTCGARVLPILGNAGATCKQGGHLEESLLLCWT
jgi:hypothetical protein